MVLLAHESAISCISPICSSNTSIEPDWIASIALASPMDVLIGTSLSGVIKLWSLHGLDPKETGSVLFESESKVMGTDGVRSIVCSDKNLRMMLVVCGSSWQVIDPSTLNQLIVSECAIEALEGIIVDIDKVAIAFADSTIVLFQLPRRKLCGKQPSLAPVQFYFDESRNSGKKVAYRVDQQGSISLWNIPKNLEFLVNEFIRNRRPIVYEPTIKQHISEAWARLVPPPPTLVETEDDRTVTATIYVGTQGKLFHGFDDGSIMMMNACHAIMAQLLEGFCNDFAPYRLLSDGHSARVNCFAYPFADSARYDPNLLLSGGADFAVIVWNITLGERVHRFCCQGGPILRFVVPPTNCSMRVLNSICAIAGDNSAALLSLKELKCILLASRQQFAIIDVRWRPLDDFLLLRCEDSSVYVWQIETANLDRIVAGLTTDEVMDACTEQLDISPGEDVENELFASHPVQILRALKQKNIAALRKIAGHVDGKQAEALSSIELVRLSPPMDILQLHNCSDKAHLILFNIDSLIAGLLSLDCELCATESDGNLAPANFDCLSGTDGRALLTSLITKRIATMHQGNGIYHLECERSEFGLLSSAAVPSNTIKNSSNTSLSSTFLVQQQSLYMDTAKLLISLLHGWDFDEEVDRACLNSLKLCRPKLPICFGTVTKKGNLSLYTPYCSGKISALDDFSYKYFSKSVHWHESRALTTVHLLSIVALSNTLMTLKSKSNQLAVKKPTVKVSFWVDRACLNSLKLCRPNCHLFGTVHKKRSVHWHESRALTTVHLLSIVALSNTLMTLKSKSNQLAVKKPPLKRNSSIKSTDFLAENESQQIRQGWSNVASLHCVLLSELIKPSDAYATPRIDLLARKWQNDCIEIRDAAQALLVRELTRLGSEGRRRLIERWSNFLPTVLDSSISIFGPHLGPNLSASAASSAAAAAGHQHAHNNQENHVAFAEEKPTSTTKTNHQHHLSSVASQMDSSRTTSVFVSGSTTNSSSSSTSVKLAPPPRPAVPPIPPRTASSGALPSLVSTNAAGCSTDDESSNWSTRSSLSSKQHFGSTQQMSQVSFQPPVNSSLSSLDDPYQQCASSVLIANKLQEDQMLLCGGVHQVHRNQATSIVLLGAMGAEFPNDLQRNIDLCRATALSLLELLLTPESPLIPSNSPLRRAAIDLLGRGFVIWQPHLDLSKTILGLLNLASAEGEKPDTSLPILFSSEADASRTARHALSLISLSRPQALITTLSTEVARYNAVAQHQTIQHAIQSPLMRARNEVLRLLEQLSDKQYNFVVDLIIPVGEVLVHCLDLSLLKQRSLLDLFPSIAKFYMVAYCPNTRRLAFGGKNGAIIVHELRASKAQTVQAHRAPITALAFSQDGKYLAAYAAQDAKISFWQTQQTFLGMGQSQIRCTKSVPAPGEFPVISPGGSYQPFRARLVWINSKSLTLMLPNGKENRFTV
uniref:WD_REPEATS_REGION domain-containing protein n=1 Tax=Globodera pallida TaxID=36090 RepID=A0A183BNY2_GLOPA